VLITVPENAALLVLGNWATKIKIATPNGALFSQQVIDEFKDQFKIDDADNITTWQLREMISYWQERYLIQKSTSRYHTIVDSKIINISVRDLVDDFANTMHTLMSELGMVCPELSQIHAIQEKWLPLQKFVDSDDVCQQIINSVLSGTEISWRPLHIIEQAFVQWQLRDLHKLDMLCYNLDEFPLNTSDLKKVLINV
jgi:hypothetical protein